MAPTCSCSSTGKKRNGVRRRRHKVDNLYCLHLCQVFFRDRHIRDPRQEEMKNPIATYSCSVLAEGQTLWIHSIPTTLLPISHQTPLKIFFPLESNEVQNWRSDCRIPLLSSWVFPFFALKEQLSPSDSSHQLKEIPLQNSFLLLPTLHLLLFLPMTPYLFSKFTKLAAAPPHLSPPTPCRYRGSSQSFRYHKQVCGIFEEH